MEIDESLITYRSFNFKNEVIKIPILKIKKGTLLFRFIYDIPKDNKKMEDMLSGSFLGINVSENSFCLPNQYNVFFYPYPYIMDTNKYLFKYKPDDSQMVLFETTTDINVALLLSPSPFRRVGKGEENEILTTCDKYTYCDGLSGFYYDACFKKEFMEQNMDIMGYYGISENDSKRFINQYKKQEFKPFRKFIHLYTDSETQGVPELVLYPRRIRKDESINLKIEPEKIYDFISENKNLYNYKIVNIMKHKIYGKNDELSRFLNTEFKTDYKFNYLSSFYERKKI
jgi:hypothetical protein